MIVTQTVEISDTRRLIIDVPSAVPTGRVILTFTPADTAKAEVPLPFTQTQIEEWANAPEMQALSGALKSTGLPQGISMADIRDERLSEKRFA